jgi:cytochrome c peroxidase
VQPSGAAIRHVSSGEPTDFIGFEGVPNSAPVVVNPNGDFVLVSGESIDHDFTDGGSVFVDPDGHSLTFRATLTPAAKGLAVVGTRVVGHLDSPGAVFVTVKAADGFGGEAEDRFAVAVPVLEVRTPVLPATPFVYDDNELPLPHIFVQSRESFAPLWDTTERTTNKTTNDGAALGRVLFYDKRLSITNTVACASCHQQQHGFASPERFSRGLEGVPTKRNVLGLTNVRYSVENRYFWDLRVESLERLVTVPIESPNELGNSLTLLEKKLAATEFYPPLFEAAFGTPDIDRDRIARALAQFLRALLSFQSPFDKAFHPMHFGEEPRVGELLSAEELRGLEIFETVGRCTSCHERGAQTLDIPANNGLDSIPSDPGVRDGRFRAASLRNVAVTAPYMHDGRFATLREVIEHYSTGAVDSPLVDIRLRGMDPQGPVTLNLSEADKDALEAFLQLLTDETFLTDLKFSDPFQ